MDIKRTSLRAVVRGAYDIQDSRIEMGSRVVATYRARQGIPVQRKRREDDPKATEILEMIIKRHKKRIPKGSTFPQITSFVGDEVIGSYTELTLISLYRDLHKMEKKHFVRVGNEVKQWDIWGAFLGNVKGVGPAIGGVLLSELNPNDYYLDERGHRCTGEVEGAVRHTLYASSFWKYAGLDVGPDGRGRSKQEAHLIDVWYQDKEEKWKTRKGITYNPFLKAKLCEVLSSCFLRVKAEKSPYAARYYDHKNRLENHVVYGKHNDGKKDEDNRIITSDGRRHRASNRVMIKQFLLDMYNAWRPLVGFKIHLPYHEAKLGLKHG